MREINLIFNFLICRRKIRDVTAPCKFEDLQLFELFSAKTRAPVDSRLFGCGKKAFTRDGRCLRREVVECDASKSWILCCMILVIVKLNNREQ